MKKFVGLLLIIAICFNINIMESQAENEKIVVALDPGHDKKHAGATANGLLEHILTLKIANYCKEELEKYDNIEVYMTRETEVCPYPDTANSGKCIEQRAIAAANAGAQIYVSMHLNAQEGGSKVNGAEIIFPNSNWKADVGNKGEALAQNIQDELVKLGLTDRGIYTKNSTIGELYDDGSASDYFAVQIYNKRNSIPGIIVEHAFITNTSDVNCFLKSEEGLKQLGIADANGIMNCLKGFMNDSKDESNDDFSQAELPAIVESGYYYISASTNNNCVVDVECGSSEENAKLQLSEWNQTISQLYEVKHVDNGKYTIKNVNSQKYLSSERIKDGIQAYVNQKSYLASDNQKWYIQKNNDQTYTFINVGNGLALDVCDGKINVGSYMQVYTPNQTNAQKFIFQRTDWVKEGVYTICLNSNDKYVLDVADGSIQDGANLQLYTSNATPAQSFYVTYKEGYYIIQNVKSGKVLEAKSGNWVLGTNVLQNTENNTSLQKWTIQKNSDGSYSFICASSGLVLDVANGVVEDCSNIQLYESNGTNAQKFVLKENQTQEIIANGMFYVTSMINGTYMLDVDGASLENGANVQLYETNHTPAQQFKILYKNGGYLIQNVKSKKVLDVQYAGIESGTNVWQYEENGTLAQKWNIVKNADGTVTFISQLNGLALDVTSAECRNYSNIQVYTQNGTAAQKFVLISM